MTALVVKGVGHRVCTASPAFARDACLHRMPVWMRRWHQTGDRCLPMSAARLVLMEVRHGSKWQQLGPRTGACLLSAARPVLVEARHGIEWDPDVALVRATGKPCMKECHCAGVSWCVCAVGSFHWGGFMLLEGTLQALGSRQAKRRLPCS